MSNTKNNTKSRLPVHLIWPGMAILLLAMSFTGGGLALYYSSNDPTFGVEENYYEKALKWDLHMAQVAENERLGWHVLLHIGSLQADTNSRLLSVLLTDINTDPLSGASIEIMAFHHARRAKPIQVTLSEDPEAPGRYLALSPMPRPGVWQVRLTVQLDGQTFTSVTNLRTEVDPDA